MRCQSTPHSSMNDSLYYLFFFSSRRRHTRFDCDWSSDVCSSDLEAFDEGKLRTGMEKALQKRPVPRAQIDEALSRVVHKVRSLGDREVSSRAIGELVMEELRHLDEVAYVRFASVYRQFEDVEAFHEEIQRLRSAR